MYGEVFANTGKAIIKAPWTLALPIALMIALFFLMTLAAGLGIIGGFLYGLAEAAAVSTYLYFTGEVVARSTTSVKELTKAFKAYFWSWVSIRFVIWIAFLVLETVLPKSSETARLMTALQLVMLVALNAVPETIYVKGTRSGIDTIMASFRFLQEQWVEWLLPNALLFAVAWYLTQFIPYDLVGKLTTMVLLGALLHIAMVFRGTLYVALDGSTHRQRMFRYRNAA